MNYKERYKLLKEELSKMEDKTSNLALLLTDSMHDLEKLHPELKESEDEEIRKFLIQMAQNGHGEDKDWWNKCVAWLEKQGEQKGTLCDTCRKAQPSHSCQDITALGRCALEKQGELKPVGWSKEDERDYDVINGIIYNSCNAEDASRLIVWLKSLKDRVQPQPNKEEWSEEDEKDFNAAIQHIENYVNNTPSSQRPEIWADITKLKSLRLKKQWKPSDKQIYSLDRVLRFYGKGTAVYDSAKELLEDLKKLREE